MFARLACAFALATHTVSSVRAQGYLGFSVGQVKVQNNACCEGGDTAFKLLAGYQFTPHFATEFAYGALGTVIANTGESAELEAADWSAIASWPISNRFSVHGRL